MAQPILPLARSGSAPLIELIARTLAATSGYQMSPALRALLEEDYELLAALQRLAFAAAARPSARIPRRASRKANV